MMKKISVGDTIYFKMVSNTLMDPNGFRYIKCEVTDKFSINSHRDRGMNLIGIRNLESGSCMYINEDSWNLIITLEKWRELKVDRILMNDDKT